MKNKLLPLIILLVLSGCSKIFKIEHTPDESNVSTRPALSVPPNFNLPSPKDNSANTQKQRAKPKNKKIIEPNLSKQTSDTTDLTSSDTLLIKKLSNSNSTKNKLGTTKEKSNKNNSHAH